MKTAPRKSPARPSEKDWFTPSPTIEGIKFRPYTYGIKPLMAQVTPYYRDAEGNVNQLDLVHAFLYLHAGDLETVLDETESAVAFRRGVKRFTLSFTVAGMLRAIEWANRVIELDEASQVEIHAKPSQEDPKGDKPPKNS